MRRKAEEGAPPPPAPLPSPPPRSPVPFSRRLLLSASPAGPALAPHRLSAAAAPFRPSGTAAGPALTSPSPPLSCLPLRAPLAHRAPPSWPGLPLPPPIHEPPLPWNPSATESNPAPLSYPLPPSGPCQPHTAPLRPFPLKGLSPSEGAEGTGQMASPTRPLMAEGSGRGSSAVTERSRDSGGGAAGGGHVRGRGGVRPVNKARRCPPAWARPSPLCPTERYRTQSASPSGIAFEIACFSPVCQRSGQSCGCEHRAASPGPVLNQRPKVLLLLGVFFLIPVVKKGLGQKPGCWLREGSAAFIHHRFFRSVSQPSARWGLSVPHRVSSAGHQPPFAKGLIQFLQGEVQIWEQKLGLRKHR